MLDGEEATLGALLAGLPPAWADGDAEVATITAADRLANGRWAEADALLDAAERAIPDVPPARRARVETALATVQLLRARRLGDVESVVGRTGSMLHPDSADDAELAALALMNLGIAETWTMRLVDGERHLREGLALGRKVGRPYVEVGCLTALGVQAHLSHRLHLAEGLLQQALAIIDRVGWSTQPITGAAYVTLGAVMIDRGLLAEGERWLEWAEPILADAPEPPASVGLRHAQGMVAFSRGRLAEALAAFEEGERLTGQLRGPHILAVVERQWQLRALLGLGVLEPVRAALADAGDDAFWCNLRARLCLAEGDAAGAAAAVAPVLSGDAFIYHLVFEIEAMLLDASPARASGSPRRPNAASSGRSPSRSRKAGRSYSPPCPARASCSSAFRSTARLTLRTSRRCRTISPGSSRPTTGRQS